MATFKEYIFMKDRKKDGTYAVSIRITHNRKSRYIPTNIFVNDKQITRTGNIKDKFVQDIIEKKLESLREMSYEINMYAADKDVDQFMILLKKKIDSTDYFAFAEKELEKLNRDPDRKGTYRVYRNALISLKKYVGRDTLPFDDMKKSLIQGYYDYLLTKISPTTANDYLVRLKTFHNAAIRKLNDEEAGVIVVKYHCFDGLDREPSSKNQSKSFRKVEEMQAVIDCPYVSKERANFAKDMFILSFLLHGINMEDIYALKHNQYKNGYITYYRHKILRKCGNNAKTIVNVLEVADMIIKKYAGDKKYLIKFSRLDYQRSYTNLYIHHIFQAAGIEDPDEDIEINRIGKPHKEYTFNTARHSMATFCRNFCGYPKDVTDAMLVHQPDEVDVYYVKPYELMWEANEKLYALFDWTKYKQMLIETTV